jgi:hypothetical protein
MSTGSGSSGDGRVSCPGVREIDISEISLGE